MIRPIIRVSSVTYAIRAQKILEQRGMRSYVKKLAKNISRNGCGYGVEIAGELSIATVALEEAGIRILEVIGGDQQ